MGKREIQEMAGTRLREEEHLRRTLEKKFGVDLFVPEKNKGVGLFVPMAYVDEKSGERWVSTTRITPAIVAGILGGTVAVGLLPPPALASLVYMLPYVNKKAVLAHELTHIAQYTRIYRYHKERAEEYKKRYDTWLEAQAFVETNKRLGRLGRAVLKLTMLMYPPLYRKARIVEELEEMGILVRPEKFYLLEKVLERERSTSNLLKLWRKFRRGFGKAKS